MVASRKKKLRAPLTLALILSLAVCVGVRAGQGRADVSELPVTQLAPPPFKRIAAQPGTASVRLTQISMSPNDVTDGANWFARNGIRLRQYALGGDGPSERFIGELPPNVPRTYRGASLAAAFVGETSLLLAYGENYENVRYLVRTDRSGQTFGYAYDFGAYLNAPGKDEETVQFERQYGEGLVRQSLRWAVEDGDTLYVCNAHCTYAKSSLGLNAYITALNLKTNQIKWRSAPLVSNADTFEVVDDAIVCGYGFTREPDFLYVLDKRTGAIAQTIRVKSGPDFIVRKGDRLYVRTYDTDYVFRIERK